MSNEVWVLTYKYSDGSGSGVMELGYEDEITARHILDVIKLSEPGKNFEVVKVGIVRGSLT
jgi:hypothetical protein